MRRRAAGGSERRGSSALRPVVGLLLVAYVLGAVAVSTGPARPDLSTSPLEPSIDRAADPPSLRIGIAYGNELVWMSDERLNAALDDAVTLEAGWIRADLSWADIQPASRSAYRWTLFDRVVRAARARDLSVLPLLSYTPPWARSPGCTSDKCGPADPGQFAAFAAAAATRYSAEGVHTWEVWNEPNTPQFWKPAPSAGDYAHLLTATSAKLREADPSAFVVMGGLSAQHDQANGDASETDFLAQVSERGGNRAVDAISYHPYTYPLLPSDRVPGGTPWNRLATDPTSLRSVLAQYGTPDLPIWLTEYGAPTGGPGAAADGPPTAANPTPTHVTEALQSAIAADAVQTAATSPDISALFWYAQRDLSEDARSPENFYGLRRSDGSAKPAFYAFRDAAKAVPR